MKFIEHPKKGFIKINNTTPIPEGIEIYELTLPFMQDSSTELVIINCKTRIKITKHWAHPPSYGSTIYYNKIAINSSHISLDYYVGFLRSVKKGDVKELLDYLDLYIEEKEFKKIQDDFSKRFNYKLEESDMNNRIAILEIENKELKKRINEIKQLAEY